MPDDQVGRPAHYGRYKIQPVRFCFENDLPFWMANVIKYIMRAGYKKYDDLSEFESELRDLEKAKDYIDKRMKFLKGEDYD